ncbi:HEAT repeat domain-containing protein [Planococcus sp. CAU13]|uniref:HEAT repeat domain-containing protein n=1 Tax=Planococcus sp. CAU13 TaxID=1541197 RepID=UPI00052FFE8B|nr:HEAT repeat domain-containing protein [Planococcus sp. CAU13]
MSLSFFWILSLSLLFAQLVLLLALARRKQKMSAKEQAITQQYEALSDTFSSYMVDPSDDRFIEEIRTNPHQTVVLERLLNGYVSVTKGGVKSPLVAKLSEDFLSAHYVRQLSHKNWAIRMNTLYYIEDFHMQSLQPVLKEKLGKSTQLDQETQQLIRTLASLDEPATISVLAKYPDAPVRLYTDVFKRLEEKTRLEELDTALRNENNNKALKHAAISYIGMSGLIAFLPRIEDELESEEGELRIQALKAILHLQYLTDPDSLVPFLQSPSWPERMYACRIAGKLQLSRFKENLSTLLGDPVWWVRYSAAEALVQFSDGDILLTHLSAHHPDRYARDMAAQWKSSLLGSEI